MNPVLFEKDATVFTTLGLCRLPDAISCTVTEERNGAYELEMVYPVSGRYFDEIAEDRILAVIPSDGAEKQAFRIYRITTPINGQVTVNARHISYQLAFIPIGVTSGTGNAQTAMTALKSAALEACPFSFQSDINTSTSYAVADPVSLRSALGGMEGSILETYGGEFEWDNWTVKLHSARGKDNGVRITYGKNLTDLTRSVDVGETITGVAAYYKGQNEDGTDFFVYSSPRVITNAHVSDYAHARTIPLDLSGEFDTTPTTTDVTNAANDFLATTTLAYVSEAVEVNFVALWQSPEYIAYAPLERVGLCDTVYIGYPQLGIAVKKKVTRTVYNVLLERYDSIELGGEIDAADTIAALTENTENADVFLNVLAAKLKALAADVNTVKQAYLADVVFKESSSSSSFTINAHTTLDANSKCTTPTLDSGYTRIAYGIRTIGDASVIPSNINSYYIANTKASTSSSITVRKWAIDVKKVT